MIQRAWWIACCLCLLAGCAGAPVAQGPGPLPWRDEAFGYSPALVTVGREDLFRLDPALEAQLRQLDAKGMQTHIKLKQLLAMVFGVEGKSFAYSEGPSTTAAGTWQGRRGDCLSLTVLTFSMGRALGMNAEMQEVTIPVFYDRRGPVDVVSQHVNVLFRSAHRSLLQESHVSDVVVDFEPQFASHSRGRVLSEDAILARFYNNIATDHLANGRKRLAYAHFRAAIAADPAYAAPYGNLALLYKESQMAREAEQLLQHALLLSDRPDVPLQALYQLLTEQGRTQEANRYERDLQAVRSRSPYHWLGQGIQLLEKGEVRQAIGALEKAGNLSRGFDDLHRYLAVAYWRAGDVHKARGELALMASAGDEAGAAKLRRKLTATQ